MEVFFICLLKQKREKRQALHIPVLHYHLKDAHLLKSSTFVPDINNEKITEERKEAWEQKTMLGKNIILK